MTIKVKKVELFIPPDGEKTLSIIEIKGSLPDYQMAIVINNLFQHGYRRVDNFYSFENKNRVAYSCYESDHETPCLLISKLPIASVDTMKTFLLFIAEPELILFEEELIDKLSNLPDVLSVTMIEPSSKYDSPAVALYKEKINNILMDMENTPRLLKSIIDDFKATKGNITFLVGAGLSAESGIPTFRGKDGYWTVGSVNYTPEEMCTLRMFRQHPEAVWHWYMERLLQYNESVPNAGHQALVKFEKIFGDRFSLITQNVDGLTYKAGNSSKRSFSIHGSINYTRCSRECTKEIFKAPDKLTETFKTYGMGKETMNLLKCPQCGAMLRPHILWFDECYNEEYYKYESVQHCASKTDLLVIVGTTGATNLPYQVVSQVNYNGKPIININPNPSEMYDYMRRSSDVIITKKSSIALNELLNSLAPSAGLEPATL